MAIECPDCRTVTRNDDAPYCMACGRKFYNVKRKSSAPGSWQILVVVGLIAVMVAIVFAQQRC